MPDDIRHYRLVRPLGEGGMGIVWEAEDRRLERKVAVKLIREDVVRNDASRRMWQEARAAASITHPNICQIFDIDEDNGRLFLVMELLQGESLSTRLRRGPLEVGEAIEAGLDTLAALAELHRRGFVHRDIKPGNLFLTGHGVKVLDFGLVRPIVSDDTTHTQLTETGVVVGTPCYMAPEQIRGQAGPSSDLFSLGAVLFEAVAGERAFKGGGIVEVLEQVLHHQPPSLAGDPARAGLNKVLRRAMAKKPEDRYPDAESMSADLKLVIEQPDAVPEVAAAKHRLLVLPFRQLRPDEESAFLGYSLADAIIASLAGLDSVSVRSSLTSLQFDGPAPDLKRIAAEADVDVVLSGSLLRAGDQLRVTAQLVEAPDGKVIRTHTAQVLWRNIFALQDDLVQRLVNDLALPLSARDRLRLRQDSPADPSLYQLYLRANELSRDRSQIIAARDLYLKYLEADPQYAPAWARLGRCYLLLGKYREESAEYIDKADKAFRRALELNPDSPLAHSSYAHLECDLGRADAAMMRLLDGVRRMGNSPDLFAGLVYACRFCGLREASVAAHVVARRLDPNIRTSVTQTYFWLRDYDACIATSQGDIFYIDAAALAMSGREPDAITLLEERLKDSSSALARHLQSTLLALLQGRNDEAIAEMKKAMSSHRLGPEELNHFARQLARAGDQQDALTVLEQVVELGFTDPATLDDDPWLEELRTDPRFKSIRSAAEARHAQAEAAFLRAGGPLLVGLQ